MPRRVSHSEERWAIMEAEGSMIARCVSPTRAGTRCKREALAGTIVCDRHGGHLPNVQRRAKEGYVHLADKARSVVELILDSPNSSDAAKLKAAEIVGRAAGLDEAHKIVVDVQSDPLMKLMADLFKEPDGLLERPAEPLELESGVVAQERALDAAQEAQDRLEESWIPDAAVIRPEAFGKVGPYAYRGRERDVINGNPKPAPPGDERRWRAPDDAS